MNEKLCPLLVNLALTREICPSNPYVKKLEKELDQFIDKPKTADSMKEVKEVYRTWKF